MNHEPLDRLLAQAATAPARPLPDLEPGLENRVLAAVRLARRSADPLPMLRILRTGLAIAGFAAVFSVVLTLEQRGFQSRLAPVEEAFSVPEPETYLALQ